MRSRNRGILLFAILGACSRPLADRPKIVADPPKPHDAAVDAETVAAKPRPGPERAYCESDAECAWDDPCSPSACVGKARALSVACEESLPPPGRCFCGEHVCTLVRFVPKAVATGCKAHDQCEYEPASGTCRAGKGPRTVEGGGTFCACDGGACRAELVAPVACKTTHDCSWLEAPWRPVSASKVPRPSPPVVPCSTGTKDVVCVAGSCVLRHWKC